MAKNVLDVLGAKGLTLGGMAELPTLVSATGAIIVRKLLFFPLVGNGKGIDFLPLSSWRL